MPQYFGIDFGTTNSALALADENGLTCLAMYPHAGGETSTFRSVIHFDPEHRNARGALVPFTGPAALDSYLAADGQGRLIQSLKSYLASELFRATSVFGRTYTLEELAAVLLSGLAEWTQGQELEVGVPVVGRPVRFAKGDTPQADAFAITRLRAVQGRIAEALDGAVPAESAGSIWVLAMRRDRVDGVPFNVMSVALGGAGARPSKDGLSTTAFPSGVGAIPVEVTEVQAPLVFWHKEYLSDSGGVGRWRGGLAQRIEIAAGGGAAPRTRCL
ncbi:MAG: hydantoinase B/oxoprolinase family protein, partial [Deltaproteobacteria bacterium]